jgi:tetratricopeptide (TPR) repeat protein
MLRRAARLAALILSIVFLTVAHSWASASKDEICDINADYALGREDYPAAILMHRNVLRAHSSNALAHYHLGFAYGMIGKTKDEVSEYLLAVKLGLNNWDLFLNLGLAYLAQSNWPNAVKSLQTAVAHGPTHAEAHFNLALAYEKCGKFDKALQEVTASLKLAPKDPDEHNEKAIICSELRDFACAREEWTYLVKTVPGYMTAQINLAILDGSYAAAVGESIQPSSGASR